MSSKRYWKIEGYDSFNKTFERVLPEGSLSESEIVVLLQRLSARHLDEDEIVSSSLRKNTPGYTHHLESHFDQGDRPMIRVGDSGPYYVASIWQGDELSPDKD